MDRLLFGDNQFFGVNHMSEEKARAQALRFRDTSAIVEVLDVALAEGIRTFMCTTHDRMAEICSHMRADPKRYGEWVLYPCMPYAHKYNDAVTELGMLGTLRKFTPQGMTQTLTAGGRAVVGKDIDTLVRLLVDAEMKPFAGLSTPVIFLQNVVVDFLMGLGFDRALRVFADHVAEKYDAEPGFITMNLPHLVNLLENVGIENPIICANINKIGFRMSGGIEAYERTLSDGRFRAIAMSIMASGAISPEEAMQYVAALPNISSVVFGASSRAHIRQTKQLADRYLAQTAGEGD